MVEDEHLIAIGDEALSNRGVFLGLLWFIMRRPVDEDTDGALSVEEVRAGVSLWNPELSVVGLSETVLSKDVEETPFKLRVAQGVEAMPRIAYRRRCIARNNGRGCQHAEEVVDQRAVDQTVVALVAKIEQAVVAGGLAAILVSVAAVFVRSQIEVAEFEGGVCNPAQVARLEELSEDASATLACFVEEQVIAALTRR